jgi:iron complex outermembrane receptor protein
MAQNWLVRFSWICFVGFCFMAKALILFPLWALAEEGEPILMDEIVVTATKTTEKRKDIPNAVILMDDTDIQVSPAKSPGELLANELGVDWRTRGNYGGAAEEIHIRGMSGDATQVLVNGVSINSPSFGSADFGRIPLNNIERIEVVKGSGSLLYGSGAMGGTLNIITKRPRRYKTDFKVSAGYGSEDAYVLSAEQGMFVWGDLGYYLTANRRETNGFRDNSDLTHNDVSLKLVFDKGDALDISLYGDYIDREYGRPGVKPPKETQDYFRRGIKFYNGDAASLLDKGSNEDSHVVLRVKSQPEEWLAFDLKGDYTYMENYNYSRYNFNGKGGKTWTTNKVFGAEGNVSIEPFEGSSVLLGVQRKDYDWENKNVDLDESGAEVSETRSTTDADLHTTGTFAEAQYRPWTFFKALAGIRHEDHSKFGTETLPRYGMIFNPLENTALKMSHGKHFLAPTPNDLFWPEDPMGKGNPNLKPETGWHTDSTIEQAFFDKKLFITLSYFHWDIDNKIEWAPDSNWVWTPQNLDSYNGDGWELGTKIGPLYNLSLTLNYTNTDAEEENQFVTRRAAYTPEDQFKGNLTYWGEFGLTATAVARYVGDRDYYGNDKTITSPTNTVHSYWTIDLRVEQRLFDHLLVSFRGYNLFDKEYDTYLSTFKNQDTGVTTVQGFPGAGRSVFFSVTYEY